MCNCGLAEAWVLLLDRSLAEQRSDAIRNLKACFQSLTVISDLHQ